jgi:ferritin-like metal-binding protein YciE
MQKMIDLRDLLKHEIIDLYSVEEQILAAIPKMIEKASNPTLKRLLREHLKTTEKQKSRLTEISKLLHANFYAGKDSPGFFSRLFGGLGVEDQKCIGIEGIIKESEKVISLDMNPEVLDAAIIASAQKIEHYEICGYGTAVAYARELRLYEVTTLLEQSLDEEYVEDDSLTNLAVGQLNVQAEFAGGEIDDDDSPLPTIKKVKSIKSAAPSVTKKPGSRRTTGKRK